MSEVEQISLVDIAALCIGDMVRATLGEAVIPGRVEQVWNTRGHARVWVSPPGEVRGFELDATWNFQMVKAVPR
jgi:hypothetical protein